MIRWEPPNSLNGDNYVDKHRLTFTLYHDGKFEIEYDYNTPEDYEETDEVITVEEINRTFLK